MIRFVSAVSALLLVAFLVVAGPVSATENWLHKALGAPENLRISGSARARIEAIDGQFRPTGPRSDTLLSFRTSLFTEYDAGPVRFGAELFDARAYLEAPGSSITTSEVNVLELVQAYVAGDLGDAFGAGSEAMVRAGRFTMETGSRRLVSRSNYRNSTNAFTGVRFDWTGPAHDGGRDRLALFWTMPQIRLPSTAAGVRSNAVAFDRESLDVQFFGTSFTRAGVLGGSLEIYGYGLIEQDAPGFPTANRRLFTPGIRLARPVRKGATDYDVELVLQRGTARANTLMSSTRDLPVSAWFAHAEIGHSFAGPWSPRLAVDIDYASGDGSNPETLNRFDTLFGARRADFGPTSLFGALSRANIISPAVRLEVAPGKRFDAAAEWRPAWLASATDSFAATGVRDPTGRSGRYAGQQFEVRARYWLVPSLLRLEAGGAVLAKAGFLNAAPNARADGNTRYGYCDVTVTF